jgi:hypothetical protein
MIVWINIHQYFCNLELVGGFNHLETYSSMGRIIPYSMENKNMFETTNQNINQYSCNLE